MMMIMRRRRRGVIYPIKSNSILLRIRVNQTKDLGKGPKSFGHSVN
jgi:hypothetical protein